VFQLSVGKQVIALRADEHVVASLSKDDVVPAAAVQPVVAFEPLDAIVALEAIDAVRDARAQENIVAAGTEELLSDWHGETLLARTPFWEQHGVQYIVSSALRSDGLQFVKPRARLAG
jgi:hypothetical protein